MPTEFFWPAQDSASSGTVTSVALTVPAFLSVSGSPITTSGTLAVSLSNQSANTVFAGPSSGGAAAPTFRALVATDLPAGTGTVTSVGTGAGLTGGPITTTGTISLANTAVVAGSYTLASLTVDAQGRLTSASNGTAVTSVALSLPGIFTVSGSPVTTTGTLTGTLAAQSANLIFAGPSSGGAATPTFRALVAADVPITGITALTGDVTASGTGSVVATIAVGAVTDTKGSLANKPAITVVATTNQALTGTPTIDGQLTVAGTSVALLTAQSTGAENGPWVVQAGAWNRPTWYPSGGTTQAFQFITTMVRLGTTYQGTVWRMTTSGAITIDTTATTWVVTPVSINSSTITGILPLANGGTNKAITPAAGGLAWTDTDSFEIGVAGTTGQAAVSGGTGAPTWFAPTAGSVLFAGTGGILQQDNANLFWDDTNNSLGIGNAAPGATFKLNITGPQLINSNSATAFVIGPNGTTNPALTVIANAASSVTGLSITSGSSGNGVLLAVSSSGSNEDLLLKSKGTGNVSIGPLGAGSVSFTMNSSTRLSMTSTGTTTISTTTSTTNSPRWSWASSSDTTIITGEAPWAKFNLSTTRQHATGNYALQRDFIITPTTHGFVGASTLTNVATASIQGPPVGGANANLTNVHTLLIETAATANATNAYGLSVNAPSAATNNYAAQFIGGNVGIGTAAPTAPLSVAEAFKVATSGLTTQDATMTAGGTTGNQTINKPTGSVNFAAAATSLTVTNSLVSTNSIITCVVMTNDTTADIKNVVPSSGSFVITLNAAATAETKVGFVVHN